MSISLGVTNGIKVDEIKEGEKIRLNVEMLLDGEKLTENNFICSSPEEKEDIIVKKGFKIMSIWESEFKNDKEKTIQKCIDFINE